MEIVTGIISAILPSLIKEIESQTGFKPSSGNLSGVAALIAEINPIIEKYIPSYLKPSLEEVEKIVSDLVEAELKKL